MSQEINSILKDITYTAKDLKSAAEIKWCAGCGDYGILAALQRALPELGVKHENLAVVSGIGCSSRMTYYMETYGFHSIHGRASAIATGVKLANPELSVWQIGGDGDILAIGGNHFIHAIRRNIDINILILNNEIYGLTKGQYSPTSPKGAVTKSSPFGTVEQPFNPGALAIGCGARFFARSIDTNIKHAASVFVEAGRFRGTATVEVLQNCVIFNSGVFDSITAKDVKDDRQLYIEHGKPMIWGKELRKGLVWHNGKLSIAVIGQDGVTEADILVHDATEKDTYIHSQLASMRAPLFPVVFGVIRAVEDDTYGDLLAAQNRAAKERAKFSSVDELLNSGDTWTTHE